MATTRRRKPLANPKATADDWVTQGSEATASKEPTQTAATDIVTTVPLKQIQVAEERTRPLNPEHVQELQNSIAIVGLGQPLICDRNYNLIAGGHRLAAIQQLKAEQLKTFKKLFPSALIPVRVYDFDAIAEPDRAEAIEIAENEKRRDYTPTEVKALAQKYIEQGYSHTRGKPKSGEKPLIPALQDYFRLSRATIKRYLSDDTEDTESLNGSREPFSPKAKRIKTHIDYAMRLRKFLTQEKLKGTRAIDNVLKELEVALATETDDAVDF